MSEKRYTGDGLRATLAGSAAAGCEPSPASQVVADGLGALDRGRADPEWSTARSFYQSMATGTARAAFTDTLVSVVMPADADKKHWASWLAAGTVPRMRWLEAPRTDRKTEHSRDFDREVGQVDRCSAREARLRAEAAALVEEADREAEEGARAQYRARQLLHYLSDLSLHRALAPVFAMGPGWVVLEAVATLEEPHVVLQWLDALRTEPDFRSGLGAVIEAYIVGVRAEVKNRAGGRPASPLRLASDYRTTLPDGVGVPDVVAVFEKLIGETGAAANACEAFDCTSAEVSDEWDTASHTSLPTAEEAEIEEARLRDLVDEDRRARGYISPAGPDENLWAGWHEQRAAGAFNWVPDGEGTFVSEHPENVSEAEAVAEDEAEIEEARLRDLVDEDRRARGYISPAGPDENLWAGWHEQRAAGAFNWVPDGED